VGIESLALNGKADFRLGVRGMNTESDYAKVITAAHRGSNVAQNALAVIEDVRFMLIHSCDEHHIIAPRELEKNKISDILAHTMIERSPWLQAAIDRLTKI
jgi:hypothetical protein